MAEVRPLRVFLCHASEDKPTVRALYSRLKSEAWIDPWLDVEKLLPGQDWRLEIEKAVRASDVVIVCLSNNSLNKKGYVQKEIREALDVADEVPEGHIYIIPLRLEECEVPARLSKWQWANFYGDTLFSFNLLLSALKSKIIPSSSDLAGPEKITALEGELSELKMEVALAYDATIEGWARALELQDKESNGHIQRVTDLTVRFAFKLGLKSNEIIDIRRGALLHDIGKMGVPDDILIKPNQLSTDEWNVLHKHPQFAYDLLAPIKYLRSSIDIPYCHHENWDGTGYPRGLKGTEIPLPARIFAIVDVWDTLLSDHKNRLSWSKENALKYLREESGRKFDPDLVKTFCEMVI